MEYIILGISTLISILIGIIVGLLWLIKARNAYFKKWYLGICYIFLSIIFSSLVIKIIDIFLWILYSKNHQFDINDFLQSLYNIIIPWGLTSGFTSLIIFIIGLICIIIHRIIQFFEDNYYK